MDDRLLLTLIGVAAVLGAVRAWRARGQRPRFVVAGVARLPAPPLPGGRMWCVGADAVGPVVAWLAVRRRVLWVGAGAPRVPGGPVFRMDPEDADGLPAVVDALGAGPEVVVVVPITAEERADWEARFAALPAGAVGLLLCGDAGDAQVRCEDGVWAVEADDARWELRG